MKILNRRHNFPAVNHTLAQTVIHYPENQIPVAAVIHVPILRTAREKVGKAFTANIVAVGAINEALSLFDQDSLLEGVQRHIPAGTEELNSKALEEGKKLISPEIAEKYRVEIL